LGGTQPIAAGLEPIGAGTIEPIGGTLTPSPAAPTTFQPIQLLAATDEDHCLVLGVTATMASQCYPPQVGDQLIFTLSMKVASGCGAVRRATVTDTLGLNLYDGSGPSGGTDPTCNPQIPSNQNNVYCYGTYTLQPSDFVNNKVNIEFSVAGYHPNDDPYGSGPFVIDYSFPLETISLDKTVQPTQVTRAGNTVTYTYTVTNTGEVTLVNPSIDETNFTGTGPLTPPVCAQDTLAVGESTTCTATYTVTSADAEQGVVNNTAVANAEAIPSPQCTVQTPVPVTSTPSSAKVTIPPLADLTVTKKASTDKLVVGQVVTYTYTVNNTGNETLSNVQIADKEFTGTGTRPTITCPTTPLAPGGSVDCTGTYTVTQTDFDNGTVKNIGEASATGTHGETPTADSNEVTLTADWNPQVELDKSANQTDLALGETVTYNYTVRNTGNETLTNIKVVDKTFDGNGATPLVITCPTTTVSPGGSVVCTATYVVVQADMDQNEVTNMGTVTADDPHGTTVTADSLPVTLRATVNEHLSVTKSANTTQLIAGQVVTYTYTVTNDGNETLTNVAVTEKQFDGDGGWPTVTCPAGPLGVGGSIPCTATYTVTQNDVDQGSVVNIGTARGADSHDRVATADSNPWTLSTDRNPKVSITKAANTYSLVDGETVTYLFTVSNDGNETLHGVQVADDGSFTGHNLLSPITCLTTEIGPGGTTQCTATYLVSQDDVDEGTVENTAQVTATDPHGTDVSGTSNTVTLTTDRDPKLTVVKTGSTTILVAGQTVTYTFEVTNIGNETLHNVAVADGSPAFTGTGPFPSVTCPTTTLSPQGAVACTATYTVTQEDVDNGSVTNTAVATATGPHNENVSATSNQWELDTNPAPGLTIVKSGNTTTLVADQVVTYSFLVTNTGNETLTNVSVQDLGVETVDVQTLDVVDSNTVSNLSCPATTLAPLASMGCTATYTVTQADVDAGQVVNTATASGIDPHNRLVPADPSTWTMTTDASPKLTVTKVGSTTTYTAAGQTVGYTITVQNIGNETLHSVDVAELDFTGHGTEPTISCPATTVAPGGSVVCTASYTTTQLDVDQGTVSNSATVTAVGPHAETATATSDPWVLTAPADPRLSITKRGSTDRLVADQTVTFTFTVTNTGNETLTGLAVADANFTGDGEVSDVDCQGVEILAPTESVDCTATYQVTQADVDAGIVTNSSTATATDPHNQSVPATSNTWTMTTDEHPGISVVKTGSTTALVANNTVTYSFVVTNTGNETVHNVAVTDADFTGTGTLSDVTCQNISVAPGGSLSCTATYTVNQADVDQGTVTNTAVATATDPHDTTVTSDPSNTWTMTGGASALSVVKLGSTSVLVADQDVTYTFMVTNTGTETLHDVAVTDDASTFSGTGELSLVACPTTTLAPNGSVACTATYTVTQQDVDNEAVVNSATATAKGSHDETVSADSNQWEMTSNIVGGLVVKKLGSTTTLIAGQTVTYSFVVTNTTNETVHDVAVADTDFTGSGQVSDITCPTTVLAPNGSMSCTATYEVTQDDVDNLSVENTATAQALDPHNRLIVADPSSWTMNTVENIKISVEKSASTKALVADQTVTYTFTVTNIGNETIHGVAVTDDDFTGNGTKPLSIDCPAISVSPGGSMSCSATYQVTQADVDQLTVDNTAVATAVGPHGETTSATSNTWTLSTDENPQIQLQKLGSTRALVADQEVTYTFNVSNIGNETVHNVQVTDDAQSFDGSGDLSAVSCPVTTIAPGGTVTCTATYTVTQADVDQDSVTNTATATAEGPHGVNPLPSSDSWTMTTVNPVFDLKVEKSANTTTLVAGQDVTYNVTVTNTGTETLHDVTVDDHDAFTGDLANLSDATCPATPVGPGGSVVCTVTYTVTQADVDQGTVENTATAEGTGPHGELTPIEPSNTVTLKANPNPQLTVSKAANTTSLTKAGQSVLYSFLVTNTGNETLHNIAVAENTFTGNGTMSDVTCTTTTVGPGGTVPCSVTYVVTQQDMDQGSIVNTAVATADGPHQEHVSAPSNTVTLTVVPPTTWLTVDKVLVPGPAGPTGTDGAAQYGDTLTYQISVTNVGNQTLSNVRATDTLTNAASARSTLDLTNCQVTTATTTTDVTATLGLAMAPGDVLVCQATYPVTVGDMNAKGRNVNARISNVASATGNRPGLSAPVSATSDPVVTPLVTAGSVMTVSKVLDPGQETPATLGQTLEFTITATNTGDQTATLVTPEDTISSGAEMTVSGCQIDGTTDTDLPVPSLDPGQWVTCHTSYLVTQDDIDAQQDLVNNIAVDWTKPNGGTGLASGDPVDVPVQGAEPLLTLQDSVDPGTATRAGDTARWTLTIANEGNVTLTNIALSDAYSAEAKVLGTGFSGVNPWALPATCALDTDPVTMVSPADAVLAPGQTLTCEVPYTVAQADVDAGAVLNTANVTAQTLTGAAVAMDPPPRSHPTANLSIQAVPGLTVSLAEPTGATGTDGAAVKGDRLFYVVTVTNTGAVTLTNVGVTDKLINAIGGDVPVTWGNCRLFGAAYPAAGVPADNHGGTMAPGDYMTCSTTYDVTQADVDAYASNPKVDIESTAEATGVTPAWMTTRSLTADSDTVKTPLYAQGPAFQVDKEIDGNIIQAAVGQPLTFTITFTNTGDETSTDVTLTDEMSNGKTLPVSDCTLDGQKVDVPLATLLPDQTIICHVSYIVTQDDIDAQQPLVNKVKVHGTGPGGAAVDGDAETPGIQLEPTAVTPPVAPLPVAKVQTGGTVANNSSGLAGGLVILVMGLGLMVIGIARRRRHSAKAQKR